MRYRCHFDTRHENTRHSSPETCPKRTKNTNCKMTMVIKILKSGSTCVVHLKWLHNHPCKSLQALSFRDVLPETASQIKDLFQLGYSPGLAYRKFLHDLRIHCADDAEFMVKKADRSLSPRRGDYNRLYTSFCVEQYGAKNGTEMFDALDTLLDGFIDDNPESVIEMQRYKEEDLNGKKIVQPFILAIVTPLMRRVHEMEPHSGELVFIDASSNMEEHNLKVFIICTHSVAGALPLGLVVTSDEKTQTLTDAFQKFNEMLPDTGFFGRGSRGPVTIITDNCDELRDSLHSVWPEAILLLCVFHILQQVWRWLFDGKNNVKKEFRTEMHGLFKGLVYAESSADFERQYQELMESPYMITYPAFASYIESVCADRKEWSICYRQEAGLLTRGHHTNNTVESQFLVIKESMLQRIKEYNINGLFEKLVVDLEEHYINKLLSIASGSFDLFISKRYVGKSVKKGELGFFVPGSEESQAVLEGHTNLGEKVYRVPSFSNPALFYIVDMDLGLCECKVGMSGAPCKHQYVLWNNKIDTCPNFIPCFSPTDRMYFGQMATGKDLPPHLFEGIHDRTMNIPSATQKNNIPSSSLIVPLPEVTFHTSSYDLEDTGKSRDALERAFQNLSSHIDSADPAFHKSLVVFAQQTEKLTASQLSTALMKFGKPFWSAKNRAANSIIKRAQKRKIGVQPSAVVRRKSSCKGRKALPLGKSSSLVPVKPTVPKRRHDLASNIHKTQAHAVTHQPLMKSKCPPKCRKVASSVKGEK